jgi:ATP-dependent exoDNAse (exonuclease V) beta subunit
LLHRLWPVLKVVYEQLSPQPADGSDADEWSEPAPLPLTRLPVDWQLPVLPMVDTISLLPESGDESAVAIEFDWAKEAVRMIGSVVHAELERIGEDGVEQWDRARVSKNKPHYRARLQDLGMPASDLDAALASVQESLANVLADERGRWILGAHKEAACEQALSGFLGSELVNVILDRTFVDLDGIRWIIDYKTSSHEGGNVEGFIDSEVERYAAQLDGYREAMQLLEPERIIRVALYFPLLSVLRELDAELAGNQIDPAS